jgi:hypothetical protein
MFELKLNRKDKIKTLKRGVKQIELFLKACIYFKLKSPLGALKIIFLNFLFTSNN